MPLSREAAYVEVQATRILATTARKRTVEALEGLRRKRLWVSLTACAAGVATLALAAATMAHMKVGILWPSLTAGVFFVALVWLLLLGETEVEDDFNRMLGVCAVATEQLGRLIEEGLDKSAKAISLIDRFRPQLRRIAAEHVGQDVSEAERLCKSIASSRAQSRHGDPMQAFRRFERITPQKRAAIIRLRDGGRARARIIDMSRSGVAIATSLRIERGTRARVGSREAVVVRKIAGGLVFQFIEAIPSDVFTERFRL